MLPSVCSLQSFTMSRTFLLLAIVLVASAKTFSQAEVDQFLRSEHLVADGATISSFQDHNGKYAIAYDLANSHKKFILEPTQEDSLRVVATEKFISFSFSAQPMQTADNRPQIMFVANSRPNGPLKPTPRSALKHSNRGMKGKCPMIGEEELKVKLFEQLPIFAGADVKEVTKLGFQRGRGVQFLILIEKDSKQYAINALYRPRMRELTISSIKEVQAMQPLQTGLDLIAKIANVFAREPQMPIIGSQGEPERFGMPIIGSEGEPERFGFPLLGSEGEPELFGMPLLGSEGEPERLKEEEDSEDNEGLILEQGQMVGDNPAIEGSAAEQEEQIEPKVKLNLKDER